MRALAILLLASLASCDGCSERTPGVCCTGDTECAQLGLPPGSASEYGCGAGQVCRDFYCMPEETPDAPDLDAAIDAPSGRCNPNAPFGAPTRMANVNSALEDLSIALTQDQLKAYLTRHNGIGYEIVSTSRDNADPDFPAPTIDPALAPIAAPAGPELYLYPTSSDLNIYFRRDSTWFVSTRPGLNDPFDAGTAVYVDGVALLAHRTMLSADSATAYYSIGNSPLRAATRAAAYYVLFNNRPASTFDLTDFAISNDELTLYYTNYPVADIYRTTRASKNVTFDLGLPVPNVNTTGPDIPLYISPDDCLLYLRAGSTVSAQDNDIWVARRGQ